MLFCNQPEEPALRKVSMSELDRLNKYLAHAGVGSRRQCDDLIRAGRITLDGIVVESLGTKVAPGQTVAIDGKPIGTQEVVYWLVNKPKGHICTNHDPSGRPRAIDLVEHVPQRVYTVGRLDEESEGLLLLTNDGDLAFKLTHPSYGVEKTYEVQVAGQPTPESLSKLTEGVWLSDGKARASHVKMLESQGDSQWIKVVLAEGKNREIRRMLAKLGHKVLDLKRVAIGPIWLDRLPKGKSRRLKPHEIELLKEAAENARKSYNRRDREEGEEGDSEEGEGRAPLRPAFRSGPPRSGPGRSGPGPRMGRPEFGDRRGGPPRTGGFGPRGRSADGDGPGDFEDRGPPRRPRVEGAFGRGPGGGGFRGGPSRGPGGPGGGSFGPRSDRFESGPRRGPGGPGASYGGPGGRPSRGRPQEESFGGEGKDRPRFSRSRDDDRGPRPFGPREGGPRAGGPPRTGRPGGGPGGPRRPDDRPRGDRPMGRRPRPDSGEGYGRPEGPKGPPKGNPTARQIGKGQRKGGKPAFRRKPSEGGETT